VPPQNFLNFANFKALIYPTLYEFNDQAYFSNAVLAELSKELFSSVSADRLLFFVEDIKNVGKSNPDTVNEVVNNLNKLSDILEQNSIRLVFMPTVDKYNLYSRFIINNRFPESSLFELLREQQMDFFFVDTKQILAHELEKGIKDIYYSDDTHWSNIGSSLVVNHMDSIFR
jgi:hypothetical protein